MFFCGYYNYDGESGVCVHVGNGRGKQHRRITETIPYERKHITSKRPNFFITHTHKEQKNPKKGKKNPKKERKNPGRGRTVVTTKEHPPPSTL